MILVKSKYQSNRNQDKRNAWWISFEVPFIKVLGNTYWWTPNCLAWREKKVDCFTLSYKYSSKEQDLCFQAWGEWLRLYDCLGIWIISKTVYDSGRILNWVSCHHSFWILKTVPAIWKGSKFLAWWIDIIKLSISFIYCLFAFLFSQKLKPKLWSFSVFWLDGTTASALWVLYWIKLVERAL